MEWRAIGRGYGGILGEGVGWRDIGEGRGWRDIMARGGLEVYWGLGWRDNGRGVGGMWEEGLGVDGFWEMGSERYWGKEFGGGILRRGWWWRDIEGGADEM